jgi:hypothetical protein
MGVIGDRSIIRQSSGSASFCDWPQYLWSMTSRGGRPQRRNEAHRLEVYRWLKAKKWLVLGFARLTQETCLMDWIQHDHRYLALGLELIVGVG